MLPIILHAGYYNGLGNTDMYISQTTHPRRNSLERTLLSFLFSLANFSIRLSFRTFILYGLDSSLVENCDICKKI